MCIRHLDYVQRNAYLLREFTFNRTEKIWNKNIMSAENVDKINVKMYLFFLRITVKSWINHELLSIYVIVFWYYIMSLKWRYVFLMYIDAFFLLFFLLQLVLSLLLEICYFSVLFFLNVVHWYFIVNKDSFFH